jgi:hypothetical protein
MSVCSGGICSFSRLRSLAGGLALLLGGCVVPLEPPAPVPAPPVEKAEMTRRLLGQYDRLQQMACLSNATYYLKSDPQTPGRYLYDASADYDRNTCKTWLQDPNTTLVGYPIELEDPQNQSYQSFYIVWTNNATREQVIAARGTNDLQDWEANIHFKPVADAILQVNVHAGFYSYAQKVYEGLTKTHAGLLRRDYTIFAAGHSLGGAVAMLTALYFYVQEPYDYKIKGVYTFGQPRIFDNRGATSWPDFARNVYHVENCYDPVPLVPIGDDVLHFFLIDPLATNIERRQYQHMGHEILLLDPGLYWMNDENEVDRNLLSDLQVAYQDLRGSYRTNHSMDVYISRLWALRANGTALPTPVNPAYHFGQNCHPNLTQS